MDRYILTIDQGTTSTRCALVDERAELRVENREHRQIYSQPGWVEHDPNEIWRNTRELIALCMQRNGVSARQIAAVGITNQRETTVLWDRTTGLPLYNAIVWQDTRTQPICQRLAATGAEEVFRKKTGLPLATYFSGPKIRWILENVAGAQEAADSGQALVGTMDSFLIWQLTGGVSGGVHVTDPTNASRTLLMDLRSLQWDEELLRLMQIPRSILPTIVPSSDGSAYGETQASGVLDAAIPITADLGDQQAALVGQTCFSAGEAKNTYGTGCFLLMNMGATPVPSTHGLLTTIAYQFGMQPPVYALEGSVAIAGALVQWLRDNLKLIASSSEIEALAAGVGDNGGVYFVPAFSGLFAPHWRSDARGLIVGMTAYTNRGHVARAVLEATAFQVLDVLVAMARDSGIVLQSLKVDGGMTRNDLLMQFQADLLDVPVVRCQAQETTTLGAAFAAGLAVGLYPSLDALRGLWRAGRVFEPHMEPSRRRELHEAWQRAVERSMGWAR